MSQADLIPTLCPHNSPSQRLSASAAIACQMCGADLYPSANAVDSGGRVVAGGRAQGAYPGRRDTAHVAAVKRR